MGAGETLAVCVTNRIPVADGHEDEFEERFSRRVHLVSGAPGFLRNEVHRPRPLAFSHATGKWEPVAAAEAPHGAFYEIKTWWRSMADFENWTRSAQFAEAHNSMPPKDMFSGPARLEVSEVFIATDSLMASMTLEELRTFRGEGGKAGIYLAVCGKIYDVSSSPGFYGPGGSYHVLAGRDASRALAKGLLEEKDVLERAGDLSDLTAVEQNKLEEWVARFDSKYPCVAHLAGAPAAPQALADKRAPPKKQPRAYKKLVSVKPSPQQQLKTKAKM
jgi:heme-degrading monooxygenase HmoA/predicted heme/steroid binding protein